MLLQCTFLSAGWTCVEQLEQVVFKHNVLPSAVHWSAGEKVLQHIYEKNI